MQSIPLSSEQFFGVFSSYNEAVWPLQLGLVALALVQLAVLPLGMRRTGSVTYWGLALLWAWSGAAFDLAFFASANAAGYVFGGLFLVQAVLFARAALRERAAVARPARDVPALVGAVLVAYALFGYPAVAGALGQHYPAVPTFGAPCPVTIFTFGLLLLTPLRVPRHLLIVPLLWSLVAVMAVIRWGVLEDLVLPVAGIAGTVLLLQRFSGMPATGGSPGVGETPAPVTGTRRLH